MSMKNGTAAGVDEIYIYFLPSTPTSYSLLGIYRSTMSIYDHNMSRKPSCDITIREGLHWRQMFFVVSWALLKPITTTQMSYHSIAYLKTHS